MQTSRILTALAFAGVFFTGCDDKRELTAPGGITIVVSPNPTTLAAGATQQLTAVGKNYANADVAITPTWSVIAGGGTISSAGLFTAGTVAGSYANTVRAEYVGISGTATINVTTAAVASIVVTPNPVTLARSATQQFTAVAKDAYGNVSTSVPVWTVGSIGGGTISSAGLFTAGTTSGTFTNAVVATIGSVSGTATVTVTPGALATITVTPNPTTLPIGATQTFLAAGKDASGNSVTITPTFTVAAGGGSIGSTSGVFTAGTVPGTFANTVVATSGAISGTATVNVTAGPLATITVTPNPATLSPGATLTFNASGRDAAGNPVAITPVFTIGAGGGTIGSSTGLFTAGATTGTFTNTVVATSGSISGRATVIINSVVAPPSGGAIALGAAAANGIMAGTAVSCVNLGAVNADISISPGNTLTGFGPCTVSGTKNLNNAVAQQAQIDLTTAYNTLAGLACPPANLIVANLGGTTKAPGVYCSAGSIGVTGTLTLDGNGDSNAVFVFQAGSSLTTAGSVVLINGAQAKNVYWQVGSSATIGTASQWKGNIVALTSISLIDNAILLGRALARNGAVTLTTGNIINLP